MGILISLAIRALWVPIRLAFLMVPLAIRLTLLLAKYVWMVLLWTAKGTLALSAAAVALCASAISRGKKGVSSP